MESKLLTAERFVDKNTGFTYRYVFSDTEYFRPHYHDYFELFLMLDGYAIHMVNGAEIPLSKGSLVFIRPFDNHDYICVNGKPFSMLNIAFSQEICDLLFGYLGDGFKKSHLLGSFLPPEIHLSDYEFKKITKYMDSIRTIDPENHMQLSTALRVLLFRVFTTYFSENPEETDETPFWLEEMCNQLRRNGNFTKGSEYFFSLSDKSREHISRMMKKHFGLTVSEFVNSLRLNYIANMLINSNHSISHIIFESGFNNISWATEQFKNKFGVTMRDYRKSAKK
jgi:AraC family cel operon transcriptional repressor